MTLPLRSTELNAQPPALAAMTARPPHSWRYSWLKISEAAKPSKPAGFPAFPNCFEPLKTYYLKHHHFCSARRLMNQPQHSWGWKSGDPKAGNKHRQTCGGWCLLHSSPSEKRYESLGIIFPNRMMTLWNNRLIIREDARLQTVPKNTEPILEIWHSFCKNIQGK